MCNVRNTVTDLLSYLNARILTTAKYFPSWKKDTHDSSWLEKFTEIEIGKSKKVEFQVATDIPFPNPRILDTVKYSLLEKRKHIARQDSENRSWILTEVVNE